MQDLEKRFETAKALCTQAGEHALAFFRDRETLVVDQKGAQDWVSEADRDVERLIRAHLAEVWPDDGVYGEEQAATLGTSGFNWVIDPIDGTTNFVNGIPAWTIVLAGVSAGQTQIGVIHDPIAGETFAARRGDGATVNDAPIRAALGTPLASGTVALGYSNRVEATNILSVVSDLIARGAMFHRNASGALSLAYVAAGRLLGYLEEHMNAWDCLAGQLLIHEAGGRVEDQNANEMIAKGGRVVAGSTDVFPALQAIADANWGKV